MVGWRNWVCSLALQGLAVQGQAHGVQAVVHKQHMARDGGGHGGQQEGGGAANLNRLQLLLDGGVLVRVPKAEEWGNGNNCLFAARLRWFSMDVLGVHELQKATQARGSA